MIELTAAFIVGWMARPLWDFFLKPVLNNAIRKHLRDLDSGVADKISLLKMLVIKSDEAD